MRISLSLNPAGVPVSELVGRARRAEAAGFDRVFCYDHVSGASLGGGGSHHVWSVLAAVATSTSTIGIGSLVANVTTRPAVDIALAAATLQDVSDGRFVLGLGAGASGPDIYAAEMAMFGLDAEPAPRRRARVSETIGFLRALWRGDDHFAGEWCRFDGVRDVAVPSPVPPIVVGANGPKMAALAGEHADAVNLHSWESDLESLIAVARRAARRDPFEVTVEAPSEPAWLDPDGDQRRRLVEVGVDELILAWNESVDAKVLRAR
jgi:alkanesulfonate monooxygenase SsuD/methylene tetrahydromethanopterin reductase-like flavin-dependent oxidoreductase (luciferase family)